MSLPELSVIVPVYNGTACLRETLDALLAQTFKNFELVAVDDGSKDDSGEIVRLLKDSRVRLIRQENRGLCHTLNRAIQEARAPLIARNDQDDVSLPNRLERQMTEFAQHPEALALYSHYSKFGRKRKWSNADKQESSDGAVKEVDPLKDGCLLGSTMMARTQALRSIGGYRQECYPCDDYDLEMRLAEAGKILLLRERLVAYRFHVSANTYRLFVVMQNKSRWVEDNHKRRLRGEPEKVFERFMASQDLGRLERLHQRRLDAANLHMRVAGQRYLDGHNLAAFWHSGVSLLLNPMNIFHRVKRLWRFHIQPDKINED
jgi:glycosyltransferase involved in cell wall biosynthesis